MFEIGFLEYHFVGGCVVQLIMRINDKYKYTYFSSIWAKLESFQSKSNGLITWGDQDVTLGLTIKEENGIWIIAHLSQKTR